MVSRHGTADKEAQGSLRGGKPWRGAPVAHGVQSFQAKMQGPQVESGELPELRSQG